jgi:hypothetical protein
MGRITSRSWTPEELVRLEHLADNGASVAVPTELQCFRRTAMRSSDVRER